MCILPNTNLYLQFGTIHYKTGTVHINFLLRRVPVTIDAREKQISITYSEYVSVALVIRYAKRMRHFVLSSVACPALPYFSTLSHARHDFRQKVTEYKMCVLIFSTTFVWNISHFEKNSVRYDLVISVKGTGYPLHLPVSPSLPLPCVTVCHHISTGL